MTVASAPEIATLLLVEDHPVNRRILADLLERDGHTVTVASNAAEALAALDHAPVDAVLTDLHLPDWDGCALARAIRARPAHADLPVFAVTANASEEAAEQARDAGMDGILAKPPDLGRFYAVLAEALAGRIDPEEKGRPAHGAPARTPPDTQSPGTVTAEEVAAAREGLASALAEGDPAAVANAAHRLAGVAAFAEHPQLAAHARAIEDAAADGDLAGARRQFEAIPRL